MGRRKNSKGTLRYSLNLFLYNKSNLLRAKKIALTIENDMVTDAFDDSLERFKALITQTGHQHLKIVSVALLSNQLHERKNLLYQIQK
jgi:hypothetical protein